MDRLLGPAEIRSIASELGLRPTKSRGQNFVIDPNTVRSIVARSGVDHSDCVLEVGPGLGSLTLALLDAAGQVTAVEIDPLLADRLPQTIRGFRPERAEALRVICADAATLTPDLLGPAAGAPPTALVANLPYNVAVPILLHLLEVVPTIVRALVMVQREVADRICAAPGSKTYGAPSVKTAWYASASSAGRIGRKVFWPEPKVDSGLVRLERRDPPRGDRGATFTVIDAAFAVRRKTLRTALAPLAGSPQRSETLLRASDIDPARRGETLTVAEFARLAEAFAADPVA